MITNRVLLDVWDIGSWFGSPIGREGQSLQWVAASDLDRYIFPAANDPIIAAARLPAVYAITPEPGAGIDVFLVKLQELLDAGIRLVQLRTKLTAENNLIQLIDLVLPCAALQVLN